MPHMDSIGVRQLQQNAATTVERVRLGESIEVTVRGRPVAKLVPVMTTLLVATLYTAVLGDRPVTVGTSVYV